MEELQTVVRRIVQPDRVVRAENDVPELVVFDVLEGRWQVRGVGLELLAGELGGLVDDLIEGKRSR